jgi:hypothetical protein
MRVNYKAHQSHSEPVLTRRVVNSLIVQVPTVASLQSLRDVFQLLADGQVVEHGATYTIPNFFLLIVLIPSSFPTSKIPRFLTDKISYQIRIDENVPQCNVQLGRRTTPLTNIQELEMITRHIHEIYISPEVWRYVKNVILGVKRHVAFCFSVSARTSTDLLLGTRIASMLLFGSKFVLPEHVQIVALNLLSFRVLLRSSYEKNNEIDGDEEYSLSIQELESVLVELTKRF